MRKKVILVLAIVFIGIQFIPVDYNLSTEESPSDISQVMDVPKDIQTLFKTSCYDCHSNNTQYPWYSKIQPGSWFMENHIKEGKDELNFSVFGTYSKRKQKSKLKSILGQLRDDEMPLFSYTLIHRDAVITEAERKRVMAWAEEMLENL